MDVALPLIAGVIVFIIFPFGRGDRFYRLASPVDLGPRGVTVVAHEGQGLGARLIGIAGFEGVHVGDGSPLGFDETYEACDVQGSLHVDASNGQAEKAVL